MKVRSLRRQPAVIGGTVYRSFSLTRSPEVIVLRNAKRKEKKKINEIASGASRPKTKSRHEVGNKFRILSNVANTCINRDHAIRLWLSYPV